MTKKQKRSSRSWAIQRKIARQLRARTEASAQYYNPALPGKPTQFAK